MFDENDNNNPESLEKYIQQNIQNNKMSMTSKKDTKQQHHHRQVSNTTYKKVSKDNEELGKFE